MNQPIDFAEKQEKRGFSFGFLVFVALAAIISIFLDGGQMLFCIAFLYVCYKTFHAFLCVLFGVNPKIW